MPLLDTSLTMVTENILRQQNVMILKFLQKIQCHNNLF